MYDETVKRLKNCATQAAPCLTCDMTDDGSCIETLMKQAADAIEELQAYVDLYKDLTEKGEKVAREVIDKYPRWIPVEERLPEGGIQVLVCSGIFAPFTEVAFYDGLWYSAWDGETEVVAVTHWMPLPEPPKEEAT